MQVHDEGSKIRKAGSVARHEAEASMVAKLKPLDLQTALVSLRKIMECCQIKA